MARALADIMTELNAVYNPQRDLYNQQLNIVDPQQEAELKGLQAQKQDSFQQITDQANRRGLFYSGLPIAEEQRYTGSQFLPAVANLRSKYATQRFGLQDALTKITQEQSNRAQDVLFKEQAMDEERRQFDAQQAAAKAASGSGFFPGGGGGSAITGSQVKINPADQQLYDQMFIKPGGGTWSDQDLVNDYNATLKSAQFGNVRDQKKIQFYHTFRPEVFGSTPPQISTRINSGPTGVIPIANQALTRTGPYAPQRGAFGF